MQRLFRISSYNVLSPNLCSPGFFPYCQAENCSPAKRLQTMKSKLMEEVRQDSIVCLQEVSLAWESELHTFFNKNHYTYIHNAYGWHGNGYMGVGIAFPSRRYSLEECHIERIADTKEGGYDGPKEFVLAWWDFVAWLKSLIGLREDPRKKEEDPWQSARKRSNAAVLVKLLPVEEESKPFWVTTYHMPCAFKSPPVMTIHVALLMKYVRLKCGDLPTVVAGDFNIKPDSGFYDLITKGDFQTEAHRAECTPKHHAFANDEWTHTINPPLKSAYAEKNGKEPDYTNLARNKWMEESGTFIETLDYIFYSGDIRVVDVDELPSKQDVAHIQSYPTSDEPSDHIKISAKFEMI